MDGGNVSVNLTSANPEEYPTGSIDPNIVAGDRVAVYGLLETAEPDAYDILLVGLNNITSSKVPHSDLGSRSQARSSRS